VTAFSLEATAMNTRQPRQGIADWLAFFSSVDLPVLRQTVRHLDQARACADRVSSREITDIVLQDPLLAVRVLAYIQAFGGRHLHRDITTIGGAVMMLGVEPFFREFDNLPTIETTLKTHPIALLGVLQVILRTQRASRYARDWAYVRHDLNSEEVALAALLHDLAEILLWCFAPTQAIAIRSRLLAEKTLRSAAVQEETLGFPLSALQLALCHAWHLPELLTTLMDDANAHLPRVQNVRLAVDLARHSINGWTDAALPDDFAAIQSLLRISRESLLERLQLTPESWPGM
jgi:HD-like signal output (HDOD) protein